MTAGDHTIDNNWKNSILSLLESSDDQIQVKKLRKNVLLTLQLDDSDKAAKKQFKRSIQYLEEEKTISLDATGVVTLLKQKKRKKKKKDKKKDREKKRKELWDGNDTRDGKKRLKRETEDTMEDAIKEDEMNVADDEKDNISEAAVSSDTNHTSRQGPCKGNPQGVTRLFVGNLPFAVDETSLGDFLPNKVTHIKWITDKETGKFYGSAFIEMDSTTAAAEAVAMAGSQLMGRPIKINFAPARHGDIWPPTKKVVSGGGQAGGMGVKAMGPKPDQCVKLFIGNLSYDIDDEGITNFFASVDAEVKAIRWLHHRDSGDFKGCGFVEFWDTQACDKAATLKGKNLLGRPIRIDWTD